MNRAKDNRSGRNLALAVKALALALLLVVVWWLLFAEKNNHLGLDVDRSIGLTPEQVVSIKAIGQWEVLAVSNEELVDTVRKGLLSNDQLVRIYYGTLRFGVDLQQVGGDWLSARGDTIVATLPRIKLLDENFIDEARTQAFFESGRWTPADREALYRKARRLMLAHCMTKANIDAAENNADAQFRRMMLAMGYKNVVVRFAR